MHLKIDRQKKKKNYTRVRRCRSKSSSSHEKSKKRATQDGNDLLVIPTTWQSVLNENEMMLTSEKGIDSEDDHRVPAKTVARNKGGGVTGSGSGQS